MSFQQATRQNWQQLPGMSYTSGQLVTKDLPKVGLAARVLLLVKGTIKVVHATEATITKAEKGPFNLIERLTLKVNSGVDIVDASGFGLLKFNLMKRLASALDSIVTDDDAFVFEAAAAASGAGGAVNDVQFMLEIPIAINERDALGLLLLQNPQSLFTLGIKWADATADGVLYTSLTGFTLSEAAFTAYPLVEFYSVPARREDYPDLSLVHQILEDRINIQGVGETFYTIQRGNIYVSILDYISLNGALAAAADIEQFRLRYNASEAPYEIRGDVLRAIQRQRYGRFLGKGVYALDWMFQGCPGLGNSRDWIDSGKVTEFEQIVKVASTATLGSNNNFLNVVREQLVPLAPAE